MKEGSSPDDDHSCTVKQEYGQFVVAMVRERRQV
jgi:hypothetical protein